MNKEVYIGVSLFVCNPTNSNRRAPKKKYESEISTLMARTLSLPPAELLM